MSVSLNFVYYTFSTHSHMHFPHSTLHLLLQVMEVLRENRDSLVAALEAFVHDPLIRWRLLNTKK